MDGPPARIARTPRAGWLALLVLIPCLAWAQPDALTFKPVDEAARVPDFLAFRARLQEAVARHDADALLTALDPGIKLGFGGDGGLEDFRRLWRPGAADSPLWGTLASVLALGGAFGADGSFTAPYVFARWPGDLDAFDHTAVIGNRVRVRQAPSPAATVIASLDFSVVALGLPADLEAPWVKVTLKDGRSGFVDRRFLRSPLDYRIIFQPKDGSWRATFFGAGD